MKKCLVLIFASMFLFTACVVHEDVDDDAIYNLSNDIVSSFIDGDFTKLQDNASTNTDVQFSDDALQKMYDLYVVQDEVYEISGITTSKVRSVHNSIVTVNSGDDKIIFDIVYSHEIKVIDFTIN